MRKIALFANMALILATHAVAQGGAWNGNAKRLDYSLNIGFNIGGTMPVPLPAEVRKVEQYNPKINPHLGVSMIYTLDPEKKWGIGTEVAFDAKGMRAKDEVKYMHTNVTVSSKNNPEESKVSGDFVGKNTTNVNLHYLTLSFYGVYNLNEKWTLRTGPYLAATLKARFDGRVYDGYLLDENGDRYIIDGETTGTFDLRDDVRDFDIGVLVGGKFNLNKQLGFTAGMTWGLTDIFYSGATTISFKMQNVYGMIGITYRLNN